MLHFRDLKNAKDDFILYAVLFFISVAILGLMIQMGLYGIETLSKEGEFRYNFLLIFELKTWVTGLIAVGIILLLYGISHIERIGRKSSILGDGKDGDVISVLENSRFMTEKERDFNFQSFTYETANKVKNDGVPVRAILDKKGKLQCNFMSGAHSLVIGATGSGKTTTFINPMIQLIGAAEKGSSMIMTDPKGELLDLHSGFLSEKGYGSLFFPLAVR